jgi:hypothetical protein
MERSPSIQVPYTGLTRGSRILLSGGPREHAESMLLERHVPEGDELARKLTGPEMIAWWANKLRKSVSAP